jgi:diguanylate cyclase (GGDEF)-like protein
MTESSFSSDLPSSQHTTFPKETMKLTTPKVGATLSTLIITVVTVGLFRHDHFTAPFTNVFVTTLAYLLAGLLFTQISTEKVNLNYAATEVGLIIGVVLLPAPVHMAARIIGMGFGTYMRLTKRHTLTKEDRQTKLSAGAMNGLVGAVDVAVFTGVGRVLEWNEQFDFPGLTKLAVMWLCCLYVSDALFIAANRIATNKRGSTFRDNLPYLAAQFLLSGITFVLSVLFVTPYKTNGSETVSTLTATLAMFLIPLLRFLLRFFSRHRTQIAHTHLIGLLAATNSEEVTETILEATARLANTQSVTLAITTPDITKICAQSKPINTTATSHLPPAWQTVLTTGKPHIDVDSIICPLTVQGESLGLLITHGITESSKPDLQLEVATLAANQIALWLDRSRAVTALRAEVAQRTAQALRDPMTGLFNRRGITEAWTALTTGTDIPDKIAMVIVDLDDFKAVNTHYGHDGGDQILTTVAQRLTTTLPRRAIIARLGGDEYGILLPGLRGPLDAQTLAGQIRTALAEPHTLGNDQATINGSVGVAIWPDHANTYDELTKCADAALFDAKDTPELGYSVWTQLHANNDILDAYQLRDGISKGHVTAHYQPILQLSTGTITGFEALARWTANGKPVNPADFVRLAERSDAIHALTRLMFHQALNHAASLTRQTGRKIGIAVNLSPLAVGHPATLEALTSALTASGINPDQVTVEVTESKMFRHPEQVTQHINDIKSLGVRVALDDFGTGAATHEWLKIIPADILKIDKSFIDNLGENPQAATIVKIDVELATSYDMTVTAEGIENQTQLDIVTALGVTHGQGFHIGRPMPATETLTWLNNYQPHQ